MPELPEVETTLRGVAPIAVGRRVAVMRVYDPRLRWSVPASLPKLIAGRTIDALQRRSKYLLFRFSEGTMLVHFGMTGSLRAFSDPPPRVQHDHVDIVLDSGVTLRYHDPRRFGAMLWLPRKVAVTLLGADMVTLCGFVVPLRSPVKPSNANPELAVAVTRTEVPVL